MGEPANGSQPSQDAASLEDGELDDAPGPSQLQPPSPSPEAEQPSAEEWAALSGKKHKAKRKQLRKAMNAGAQVPAGVYRTIYGSQAKPELELQAGVQHIKAQDVQALVLWVLADRKESRSPPWVTVKNIPLIRQVVLLYTPGVSAALFARRPDLFQGMARLGRPLPMQAKDGVVRPGYSLALLLSVPFSKEKKAYISQTEAGLAAAAPTPAADGAEPLPPFPPEHYVLKPEMMARMGYPLPDRLADGQLQLPEGFVATRPAAEAKEGGPAVLLALDCEMCETLPGKFELTRVSLLSQQKEVLWDQLVLPHAPISNYHTDKSGICAETLAGVTFRLADAQQRFLQLVPAEAILVGHALENDLKALRVCHMRCIDTGALFPHPKGLPFRSALRRLAERFLKRAIQNGSHDSVVDATAALDLALLKIKHGPAFGLGQQAQGEPLPEVLMRAARHCTLVDRPDTLNKYLSGCADGVSCASDAEVTERLVKQVQRQHPQEEGPRFVWGQLRGFAAFCEARADAQRAAAAAAAARAKLAAAAAAEGATEAGAEPQDASLQQEQQQQQRTPKRGPPSAAEPGAASPAKRLRLEGSADVASAVPVASPGAAEANAAEAAAGGAAEAGEPEQAAEQAAAPSPQEVEEGEAAASEEEQALRELDRQVKRVWDALPPDSLLLLASCQGDTAATRLQFEQKTRRSQGLQQPPWNKAEEQRYQQEFAKVSQRGICLAAVK